MGAEKDLNGSFHARCTLQNKAIKRRESHEHQPSINYIWCVREKSDYATQGKLR